MGSRVGGNRAPTVDPFYNSVPPLAGPTGEPYEVYEPTVALANYGRPVQPPVKPYGGLYAQGLNQIPGVAPWNYGNYYLGNTTMQMMPMMLNKIHEYGQMQARALLGNAGLLGPASPMQSYFMPSPSFSPSFNMPISAPMMAAATPLPVAFNPLVQGMYPMASMDPVNWMTPYSFMSALTAGPMPYRPPAFDFPSIVGAVMTVPYGTPNPFLSSPSYGGYNSGYNSGFGSPWCCCCYCVPQPPVAAPPPPPPPPISYYPPPVPQPYPVSYAAPAVIPTVQQAPVPQCVSIVAPPAVQGTDLSAPVPAGAPLYSSQGGITNTGFSPPAVMASNSHTNTPVRTPLNATLPVYDTTGKSYSLPEQQVTSSLSVPVLNKNPAPNATPSISKSAHQFGERRESLSERVRRHLPSLSRSSYNINRSYTRRDPVLPPILQGELISDSGWLPKTPSTYQKLASLLPGNRRKRSVYTPDYVRPALPSTSSVSFLSRRRPRRHSGSSASEYDCEICQRQREQRRLQKHYGSSTVSSLIGSPKPSRKRDYSSNESARSSKSQTPSSSKRGSYKSHRRHPTKIKVKSKTPSPEKASSPVLLLQTSIPETRPTDPISRASDGEEASETKRQEERGETPEEEEAEKSVANDNESVIRKADQYGSKISLSSIDEETF